METNAIKLTDIEQELVSRVRDTVLGREGLVFKQMLSAAGLEVLDSCVEKGAIINIGSSTGFRDLSDFYLGLPDEKYPDTYEENIEYRVSGYSERYSYAEYLKAKQNEEIKWTLSEIHDFLNKDVRTEFHRKVKSDRFYYNYLSAMISGASYAEKLVRENNSAEEVLTKLFTKYMSKEFASLEPIDKEWFDKVVEAGKNYVDGEV